MMSSKYTVIKCILERDREGADRVIEEVFDDDDTPHCPKGYIEVKRTVVMEEDL